jgi:hypothetical protein
MSVESKRLWAVFYLSGDDADTPSRLLELAEKAGAEECRSSGEDHESLSCLWAGLPCEVFLVKGLVYQILVISIWQSDFLQMIADGEGQDDRSSLLAAAFRDACEVLQPKVAFLAVHRDQATYENILDRERWVLNGEANRFASEGLGLLYFSPEVDDLWVPSKLQEEREYLSVSKGRLMFAGSGKSRWFGGSG